jgi:chromosome segregation ATPase
LLIISQQIIDADAQKFLQKIEDLNTNAHSTSQYAETLHHEKILLEHEITSLRDHVRFQGDSTSLLESRFNERVDILEKQLIEREHAFESLSRQRSKTDARKTAKDRVRLLLEEREVLLKRCERALRDTLEASTNRDTATQRLRTVQFEMEQSIAKHERILHEKNSTLSLMSMDLDKLRNESSAHIASLKEQIGNVETRMTHEKELLEKQVRMLDEDRKSLFTEFEKRAKESSVALLSLKEANIMQNRQILVLSVQNTENEQVIQNLTVQNTHFDKECNELRFEISTFKEKLSIINAEKVNAVAQYEKSQIAISNLKVETKQLASTIEQKNKEKSGLEAALKQSQALISSISDKLTVALAEKQQIEKISKSNRDSLVVKLQTEIDHMKLSHVALQEELSFLILQKEALQNRTNALAFTIDELATSNQALHDTNESLEHEVQLLTLEQHSERQEASNVKVHILT